MSAGWIEFCLIIGFILFYCLSFYIYYKLGLKKYERTIKRKLREKL